MAGIGSYKMRIINPATGGQRREFGSYETLSYSRRVNKPGAVVFTLKPDHPVVNVIQPNDLVLVFRKPDGGTWGTQPEQVGMATDFVYETGQTGLTEFRVECPSIMQKLAERHVAWFAKTTNRSRFANAKAETIMKTLVNYNLGPAATTANGRRVAGVMTGIALEADGARGSTISQFACAWDNLLDALQKLALIGGGDFDLVYSAGPVFTFTFFPGQRGTDRSATLIFSAAKGNLEESRLVLRRSVSKTVAIVGGEGEDSKRKIAIRTSSDYSSSNHRELFVEDTGAKSSELAGIGDAALAEARTEVTFEFKVRQTDNCQYGVHYGLGDKATFVRPDGLQVVHQLIGFTITSSKQNGGDIEVIEPEVDNV